MDVVSSRREEMGGRIYCRAWLVVRVYILAFLQSWNGQRRLFTNQAGILLAPSAKRLEVFGESYEVIGELHHARCILLLTVCKADFGILCLLSCMWITASEGTGRRG